ncbi:unnamed protein product [Rhizophagus irregularis]|nr:unnamed protein product [Rhizophagus irregularis]
MFGWKTNFSFNMNEVVDQLKEIISLIDEINESDLYNNVHESWSNIDENSNASTSIGLNNIITNIVWNILKRTIIGKLLINRINEPANNTSITTLNDEKNNLLFQIQTVNSLRTFSIVDSIDSEKQYKRIK